jgi:DNA-binding XRE family transcriptional regulator
MANRDIFAPRAALIQAREKRGLTRPQLAQHIGVGREFVYSIELGQSDPSLTTMHRWIEALGKGASLDLFEPNPSRLPRLRRKRLTMAEWLAQDDETAA